jgi:hypothetical protein
MKKKNKIMVEAHKDKNRRGGSEEKCVKENGTGD